MGAIADIFAAVHLNLETGTFEVDAAKVADSAGASMGKKLKSAIAPAIGAGIGMAAGAMAAMALTGGAELDSATKRAVADMGLTGKAAEDAGHSIASMYENNLQGFDAIGAAMAKVHNDLGLTGEAADAATEKFLKFSTATGQDASAAVASFDDILDAWSLTAADAGSIMDKLVVSHQKYGGVIAESESALSAMAPAMQAANMSIDDGIALLNLFNAAGIDASKAPAALAKAVKALKPGQDLNDLIAQIGAIEDPTLRGQKAMEIFGARSGIGMAQAIKPGMTSLADLTASLGDTAGASDTAAAASLSAGDNFTLMLRKIAGPLAEFGTQFNGLLMLAAGFGPKLTTALLTGLGGIGGLIGSKVVPQLAGALTSNVAPWMTAGTKAAAIFGAGMTMALPLIAAAAVVATWASVNNELNKQADKIETQTTEWVKTATVSQLKASRDAIAKGAQDIANLPLGTTLYGDQLASLKRDFDVVDAQIAALTAAAKSEAGALGGASLAAETLAVKTREVKDAATPAAVSFASLAMSAKDVQDWTNKAHGELPGLAKAFRDTAAAARASRLDTAWGIKELPDQIIVAKEAVRQAGKDVKAADKDVADARVALAHATTRTQKAAAQDALTAALAAAAASRIALDGTKQQVEDLNQKLVDDQAKFGAAGAMIGKLLGSGIYKQVVAWNALTRAQLATLGQGVTYHPPSSGTAVRQAGGGAYRTGDVNWVGEGGPELRVAASPGYTLTHQEAMSIASGSRGGGGPTYNVNVYNPEPRAAGPDIGRVLRRTAALGMT